MSGENAFRRYLVHEIKFTLSIPANKTECKLLIGHLPRPEEFLLLTFQ